MLMDSALCVKLARRTCQPRFTKNHSAPKPSNDVGAHEVPAFHGVILRQREVASRGTETFTLGKNLAYSRLHCQNLLAARMPRHKSARPRSRGRSTCRPPFLWNKLFRLARENGRPAASTLIRCGLMYRAGKLRRAGRIVSAPRAR